MTYLPSVLLAVFMLFTKIDISSLHDKLVCNMKSSFVFWQFLRKLKDVYCKSYQSFFKIKHLLSLPYSIHSSFLRSCSFPSSFPHFPISPVLRFSCSTVLLFCGSIYPPSSLSSAFHSYPGIHCNQEEIAHQGAEYAQRAQQHQH